MKPTPTKYYSYASGELPKGCKLCVKGEKTVLFITGLCRTGCFYCPISDKKYGHDVIYANEWKITEMTDLFKEIEMCSSKGVGITGGDPLVKLDRTCEWIKKLKKKFGKPFHIHLYTPLTLVTKAKLERLYRAGLDEIRFHPLLDREKEWPRLKSAKEYDWDLGIEVPVIPGTGKKAKELINYVHSIGLMFINLNELEVADNKVSKVLAKGHEPKDKLSYGVKGSEKLGKELVEYASELGMRAHYCSAKLKDKVQLAERIKKRAKNAAKVYDSVDEEGLLLRGAIYLKGMMPGFNAYEKLENMGKKDKQRSIVKLRIIRQKIITYHKIPAKYLELDKEKLRILTTIGVVEGLPKNINTRYAIVREYPTKDQFPVEITFV